MHFNGCHEHCILAFLTNQKRNKYEKQINHNQLSRHSWKYFGRIYTSTRKIKFSSQQEKKNHFCSHFFKTMFMQTKLLRSKIVQTSAIHEKPLPISPRLTRRQCSFSTDHNSAEKIFLAEMTTLSMPIEKEIRINPLHLKKLLPADMQRYCLILKTFNE